MLFRMKAMIEDAKKVFCCNKKGLNSCEGVLANLKLTYARSNQNSTYELGV